MRILPSFLPLLCEEGSSTSRTTVGVELVCGRGPHLFRPAFLLSVAVSDLAHCKTDILILNSSPAPLSRSLPFPYLWDRYVGAAATLSNLEV